MRCILPAGVAPTTTRRHPSRRCVADGTRELNDHKEDTGTGVAQDERHATRRTRQS
jgi:hypothetical protein